jgi:Lon protease-like protein
MPLPLHIFEERYKAMIGDCLERKEPFGIVLIKEGQEVGGPAEPFRVGTTARILQAERLEEGRMYILTRGEHRFELVEVTQHLPHMVGQVKYLSEEPGEGLSPVMAEIGAGYDTFLRRLAALSGGWTAQSEVPEDPVRLSFAVATGLATSIDVPRSTRQDLLELPTARERLEKLLPLLKRGNEVLEEEVVKRNPFRGPRLN